MQKDTLSPTAPETDLSAHTPMMQQYLGVSVSIGLFKCRESIWRQIGGIDLPFT